MTTSALDIEYVAPTRPYSRNELAHLRTKLHRYLRLGKTYASHKSCGHFYRVRENGRKSKQIEELGTNDVGNCSVCWKINKTPKESRDRARNMVSKFMDEFYNDPEFISYNELDLETVFYKWLYED